LPYPNKELDRYLDRQEIVMNPLIGMLVSQLGGPVVQQISQQIGADNGTTKSAVGMALPMLLSAMGNHAATPDGANAINQATQQNDDSILDNLMGFVGNAGAASMGSALLSQVLGGGSQNAIASAIGQQTGMDNGTTNQLLGMLAPIAISALSKFSQQSGTDPSSLVQTLGGAGDNNDLIGMATKMLDADGDGNPINDLGNIIGKLF
jgi:hypothetical protein